MAILAAVEVPALMKIDLTDAFAGRRESAKQKVRARLSLRSCLCRGFFYPLVGLEHVFDVALEHEQIRCALAINFQSAAIVPFDCPFDFLTVKKNDNHRCVSVDLFFVIEDLGIGFTGRWNSLLYLDR